MNGCFGSVVDVVIGVWFMVSDVVNVDDVVSIIFRLFFEDWENSLCYVD